MLLFMDNLNNMIYDSTFSRDAINGTTRPLV